VSSASPTDDVIRTVVPANLGGQRVDRAVALLSGLSRSAVNGLIERGRVVVDGSPVAVRSRVLVPGQILEVKMAPSTDAGPRADPSVVFTVVHADPQLVVVDKPPGLVVHHGAGHFGGTLVDGLLARFPDLAERAAAGEFDRARPGIVHRLDKGTSGLLVVARTPEAFRALGRQLRERTVRRVYRALVAGVLASDSGVVDAPVGRSTRRPTRMAVTAGGRPATTNYRVLARYRAPVEATLIEATLGTGRTHQIRVHLAAIGHPVLGDDRYGGSLARPRAITSALGPGRLFLHACHLGLDHPDGSGWRSWDSELPPDLSAVLDGQQPLSNRRS
jgi:23S rRNA pseudouridine1911/1915/1917 synthase